MLLLPHLFELKEISYEFLGIKLVVVVVVVVIIIIITTTTTIE